MGNQRMFVVGGTGFVGTETIREAIARGWEVKALARSEQSAERLRLLGAIPVRGDARTPRAWMDAARGASALVDLSQPTLPDRIRPRDIELASRERQTTTRELVACLREFSLEERPLLVSVSGVDDLARDAEGRIASSSSLRVPPMGFGHIGVPVRRIVNGAGTAATFLHLGTVYGPGKSFAATVFPRLASGSMFLPFRAQNRLALIHVEDAARAIVHILSLGTNRLSGLSWIVVDAAGGARLGEFFDHAAACMGVAPPRRAPAWVLSLLMGKILFETLSRDVAAEPSDLLASGFRFTYPSFREGLPATLSALGYSREARLAVPVPKDRGWRPFRLLLVAAVSALIAVNTLNVPLMVPRIRQLAGGAPMLDLRLGYAPREAYQFLDALGPAGRTMYLAMLWTVDLLLPLLFTLFLWTAIGKGELRRWRWAALAAGVADCLENMAITTLLTAYPSHRNGFVWLASTFTASKFSLYLVSSLLALAGAWLHRRSRRLIKGTVLGEVS